MNEKPYIQIEYILESQNSKRAVDRAKMQMEQEGWKNGIVDRVVQMEVQRSARYAKFKIVCRAFHLAQD